MADAVTRYSARNPFIPPLDKDAPSLMVIDVIDWEWDDSIKELKSVVVGKQDLQAVTDSYKDSTGVKNILSMMAQGDFSMVKEPANLGDISGAPDNIHQAYGEAQKAQASADYLKSLKIKDENGQIISIEKLCQEDQAKIKGIVDAYVAGLTAKEDKPNE